MSTNEDAFSIISFSTERKHVANDRLVNHSPSWRVVSMSRPRVAFYDSLRRNLSNCREKVAASRRDVFRKCNKFGMRDVLRELASPAARSFDYRRRALKAERKCLFFFRLLAFIASRASQSAGLNNCKRKAQLTVFRARRWIITVFGNRSRRRDAT